MEQSDYDEVDFSKVSFRNNNPNTNLTIYADIEKSRNPPGLSSQVNKSLGAKITPKSIVESVSGKLKRLQVSDSLKNRQKNQRNLQGCNRTHNNVNLTNKPVYATNKFETQDISASQLVKAIDNAEELHNVASKRYTQEFEVSFQVENFKASNVNDLEMADTLNNPDFVKSGFNNLREDELELSQNTNTLNHTQAEPNTIDLPCILTDMKSNNIVIDISNTKTEGSCDKSMENSLNNNDTNEDQIEAVCLGNDDCNKDNKILNETYFVAKEQNLDFPLKENIKAVKDLADVKTNAQDANINKSQTQNNQDKFFLTPSPGFSISTRHETVLSPHIVCNLDDFERFEQFAVSFNKTCSDENENDDVYSQILGGNENIRASSDKYSKVSSIKYIEDILDSSDSLSVSDKAHLKNIPYTPPDTSNDSSSLNLSPILQIQTINVKFDAENDTLQSLCDMELTCKDTDVNIINNQDKDNSYIENNKTDKKGVVSLQKNSDFLEDEILFSSDEEGEYIHKELNELPLTCALETSFYTNQSDVLDKTMFVGFQTASNQYISISTNSFCKAKSMMEEIDGNLGPSLIELVDMCEKSAIEYKPNNDNEETESKKAINIATTKQCSDKSKQESINIIETKIEPEANCNFIGFKTASNKNIDLSEKSRQRILKVFQDIDLTDDFTKEENNCDIAIPESGLAHIDNKYSNIENTSACNPNGPNDLFTEIEFTDTEMNAFDEFEIQKVEPDTRLNQLKLEGFQTASNIAISVSENAMQMSKKVSENIDNNEDSPKVMLNTETKTATDDYVFKKPEFPLPKTKNIVVGFKTAGNKTVNYSNNSLKRGIIKIDNMNTDIITEREFPQNEAKLESSSEKFHGFQTASNKKIIISEKALEQSIKLFQDIEINCDKSLKLEQNINKIPTSVSFKTANNKPIQISNKTLEKCRKVFENIDSLDEIIPQSSFKNDDPQINKTENSQNQTQNFIGFQTASNKMINISKQLLEKTKHIFKDIDDIEIASINKIPSSYVSQIENASEIKNLVDSSTINISKKKHNENLNENTINDDGDYKHQHEIRDEKSLKRGFHGFQTASNKRVKVSKEALAKTKDIFHNKAEDYNKLDVEFKGFQTASNKEIVVSKDAVAKTKEILQDLHEGVENFDKSYYNCLTTTKFAGFQNGNKETICVSEEALKNSKIIMQNIVNEESLTTPKFAGFQTGNRKPISVTEEALKKSRKLFENLQDEEIVDLKSDSSTSTKFAGFQTGKKNTILVSDDALKKSRKIFENLQDEEIVNLKSDSSTSTKFAGFQTGNKNTILVSDEALKNSKKIFDNIRDKEVVVNSDIANVKSSKSFAFCFQNANEKEIQVSQIAVDAIRKDETPTLSLKTPEKHIVKEPGTFLDTQAISNFENTLFTEDFCKDTSLNQPKRSGSPILHCPKAKKRKSFQTPYKTEKAVKTPKVIDQVKEITVKTVYEFNNNNYKKNKTVNLKMLPKLEEESKNIIKIDEKIKEINFETILNLKFEDERNDLAISKFEGPLTVGDLKTLFLESVDKKIIPEGWIENHLKLIMWKLISYEIKFPKILFKVCTAKNVIDQLKYRYDRELYNVERPPLRKILEKDELASKCIVLCVVNLIQDGVCVESITDINKTIELTVTDGWYCVRASIDKMLSKLVYDGRIVVGCKIITHGAELINCDQGKSPLEDISEVRLKLFGNSTRLVRWHTKLGLFASAAILNRLSNVKVNGGKVSKLRLFVTRVYPMLYVEKFHDGSTVTRSERLELQYQNKYEMQRQNLMEKLYEEIERELSDEDSQDSMEYKEPSSKRKCLDSGSQIARAMKKSKDPAEFRSNLTESQVQLLNEYTHKHRDRVLQQIQTKLQDKMEKSGSNCVRNVVPLLKARVADVCKRDGAVEVCQGYISIWRPNEAVSEIVNEGDWIDVLNALPTSFRTQEIQLTAGRQTVFSKTTPKLNEGLTLHTKKLLRHCKEIKDLVKNPNEPIDYNEIDTIGIITEIDPPNSNFETSGRQFQNIYLADLEKNMICINFWGGIKKFGYENILDTGQFVYGRNLQKRVGNTRKSIPQFRVTEFSIFTKTPKNTVQRNLIDNFSKTFSKIDRKQFCNDCSSIRRKYESNKYSYNTENISPFRMNTSEYNFSKNRQHFESPLAQINRKEDDFRLTGLDFESSFKQIDTQNMSPELLKKKRIAQAKIAKLKLYGEPPPLSPMHILNKSKNATAAFKSPFLNNSSESIPTVSPKTTNEFLPMVGIRPSVQNDLCKSIPTVLPKTTNEFLPLVENRSSSPVFSLNETYTKKCLIPVKLNFNVNDCMNISVDNFAEDFDDSPPLSLD